MSANSMAANGAWQQMGQQIEHGSKWSMAANRAWQQVEHGSKWSMAANGAWQQIEQQIEHVSESSMSANQSTSADQAVAPGDGMVCQKDGSEAGGEVSEKEWEGGGEDSD
jgi:hypothetical protein